jgi:hypothetical protein
MFEGVKCGPKVPVDYFIKSCAADAYSEGTVDGMMQVARDYLNMFKTNCNEETQLLTKSPIQQDQEIALEIVKDCESKNVVDVEEVQSVDQADAEAQVDLTSVMGNEESAASFDGISVSLMLLAVALHLF